MGVSKVDFAGNTLVDLTGDSVTPETLLEGATAHNAAGELIVGGMKKGAELKIVVSVTSGATVTATKGSTTVSGTSVNGTCTLVVPEGGAWSVEAINGQTTDTKSVSVVDNYAVSLSVENVFGVCWNYGSSSTALSRLTAANDSNGLVNTSITTEPSPAVGTSSGSSPFDSYLPWAGMEEYNIIDNAVSYKKGASGFSRSLYDTVVYIPEFYYKVVDDATNSKRYFYIADSPMTGFARHPGSGRYVGKYHVSNNTDVKSGATPSVSRDRYGFRVNSKMKGNNWCQYDFATHCAIVLLYLVEFADWDSQSKIGVGGGSDSIASTGDCDSITYHTGTSASDRASPGSVLYRNIENLWANVYSFVDGVNFSDRAGYVCTNPANYDDDTSANYIDTGIMLPSSGYISSLGYSSDVPWALLPSDASGSSNTYIPDKVSSADGWRVLRVGGTFRVNTIFGLMRYDASYDSSTSSATGGCRFIYIP